MSFCEVFFCYRTLKLNFLNMCSNSDREIDTRQEKTQREPGDIVKRRQICAVSHVVFV